MVLSDRTVSVGEQETGGAARRDSPHEMALGHLGFYFCETLGQGLTYLLHLIGLVSS